MSDRKNGAAADESVSVEPFLSRLPFELTEGQSRSFRQIEQDLVSKRPMNRFWAKYLTIFLVVML